MLVKIGFCENRGRLPAASESYEFLRTLIDGNRIAGRDRASP